jgi:replication initiation and membrane attachment protein DnaB
LSFKYGLSDPLINVVVDYTIQKCKGFLPEKYAFIIASGLNSNKITSPSSAWSFLYQNENERVARKKEKEEFKAAPAEEAEKPEEGEKKKKKKVNIDDIVGDQF